ncbi:MAG TPA: penicillin acylase family protein [Candidatus Limnocylindrales bacterium]|nr:penicillin acylase family protein [Candidatus Limnocylindrales bacterium]
MGRVLRGALVVIVVIVVVAMLAVGGLLTALTASGQPKLAGTVVVPGLEGDVQVSRDASGVVHVTAGTSHDLFRGQGWVHASERMWQMEVWRRIGAGRLSELFGESQVATDSFIRTLDWRGSAERDLAVLSDETTGFLQAYADGVNAYLDGHPDSLGLAFNVAGALSGEAPLLTGLRPEPWTPVDTLTWAKVQAWGLGGNMDTEIFRMLVDAHLGDPALTDQLFPAYAPDQPQIAAPETPATAATPHTAAQTVVSTAATPDAEAWTALARTANSIAAIAGLAPARDLVGDGGVGSNNWVVAPSLTASGGALLANDPHLGFNMPSVWYVNGLHCRPVSDACPFDVAGVVFPGMPGVVAGHNGRIAWGVTNVNPDVQDLVEERVDPADPAKYLTAVGSEPFLVRTETIRVAGGDDVTLTVRATKHGSIINDTDDRLKTASSLYALRWTALAEPDKVLEAFLDVDRATDWTSFRAALAKFGAPSQNFVYADADGHIGYQMPGRVPVRTLDTDLGTRPVPGWDGRHEWTGYVPFDDLPSVFDPPTGRIVTANNAVFSDKAFIGVEFDRGDRAARILELIDEAGDGITLETLGAIQGDTTLRRGARMQASLADMRPEPATSDGKAVLDLITRWDGRCETDSTGCSAFAVFEMAVSRAIFDDDLGPQARDYIGSDWAADLAASMIGSDDGRTSPWWGDVKAGGGASAIAVTAAALDAAGSWLRRDLGDPKDWDWGRIHTVAFREATLGLSGIAPLEAYFNSDAKPVAGAAGAVNNMYYRLSRGYEDPYDPEFEPATTLEGLFSVTNGPSMRALYDMRDPDAGRIITTTGQSGQPFSRHTGDWIGYWLENETVPLPFTGEAIDGASVAVLVLTPNP